MNTQADSSSEVARTVLVLGANGRLGQAASQAFAQAGWKVLAHSRRPLAWPAGGLTPGLTPVTDPLDAIVRSGTSNPLYRDVGVVVHGMNPRYDRWDNEALPLARLAADVAARLNASLMFPGNVYNFGEDLPAVLREDTPQRARSGKGLIRIQTEQMLEQRASAGLQTVIVRAGDYFGTGAGAWFDQVIAARLSRARLTYPGDLNQAHAWAYLPDLAQVFVQIAERRDRLPRTSSFHFGGHTLTGHELLDAITSAARRSGALAPHRPIRTAGLPWRLLRMAGWFSRMPRELLEIRYLWNRPHRLDDNRLRSLLGAQLVDSLTTPIDVAMSAALVDAGLAAGPDGP